MSSNKPGDLKVYVTENRGETDSRKNCNKNSIGGSGEIAQQIQLCAPI